MLKLFLKILLFPLTGLVLAMVYPLYVGDSFKEEEITLEARRLSPDLKPTLIGVTETDWDGKRVFSLEDRRSVFPFSPLQRMTFFLQASYYLKSPAGEKIKIMINDSFLQEISLSPSPNKSGRFTATIPYPLLKERKNILTIIRSAVKPPVLYIDSLKIKNYQGYSTGLITAHVLPLPLNPPLHSRFHWNAQKTILFPLAYSLFGFVYGFILSRRRQAPFLSSIGKGAFVLLPVFCLLVSMAAISRISSGHLIVSLASFIILTVGLTLLVILIQLNLLQPFTKTSCRFLKKVFRKKNLIILSLVAITFLSILNLYSFKFNKNITGFMVIGDYFEAPQIWTPQTLIHRDSVGYDGQFYYYIAHDPFIQGSSFNHIDFPAYRYQRIIYPLTAWLLSFGQPKLIPYLMVAVNLLGILLGTYFIILILRHYGRSPWYSLFYAAFWGFLLCLLRSLPEPLAITFVVIAVYSYLKGRPIWQSISLTLAALTQETTLLVTMAFLFYFLGKNGIRRSLYLLIPLLTFFLWQLYIYIHFQTFSFLGGTQNFGPPLQGILEKLIGLSQGGLSSEKVSELLFLVMILLLILTALYDVFKYYGPFTIAFVGYALLTVFLNKLIWVEPWSYTRANLGLLVFNLLIFTKERGKLNLISMLLIPAILLFSLISMRLL